MAQMNLSVKQKHIDIKNKLVVAKGAGMEWEVEVSRCKL